MSDALRRLRNGDISIDDYLDLRTDEAVAHLRRLLPERDLATVREVIRSELTMDPLLIELVRRTTGNSA